jgi:hypothetical protein
MTAKWEEQWARVGRLHNRFTIVNEARATHNRVSDDYQDDVYAFFVSCYHFKDWLKNDPTTTAVTGDVEDIVKGSTDLSLCGDVANGFKHLALKGARVDASTAIGRRDFKVTFGEDPTTGESSTTFGAQYEIVAGSATYDAYTVASNCFVAWEQYLRSKSLIP